MAGQTVGQGFHLAVDRIGCNRRGCCQLRWHLHRLRHRLEAERLHILRQALLAQYINQLYEDTFEEWSKGHRDLLPQIERMACATHRWKREKMENLAMLLQGALAAEGMVGLKMNVAQKDLSKVMNLLPAMKRPTIASLSEPGWSALEVVIEEKTVKKLIPQLKRAGAEGIIEYPLNKVIP